jgi:hypothetical protein
MRITGSVRYESGAVPSNGMMVLRLLFADRTELHATAELHRSGEFAANIEFPADTAPELELRTTFVLPPFSIVHDTQRLVAARDPEARIEVVLPGAPPIRTPIANWVGGRLRAPARLQFATRGPYADIRIPGLANSSAVGSPALPVEVRYVLLPPGAQFSGVETITGTVRRVSGPPPRIVQAPRRDTPAPVIHGQRRLIEQRPAVWAPRSDVLRLSRENDDPVSPAPVMVAGSESHEWGTLITLHLHPVRYGHIDGDYIHTPELSFRLHYKDVASANSERARADISGFGLLPNATGATQLAGILSKGHLDHAYPGWVISPNNVGSPDKTPMIILTDEYEWDDGQSSDRLRVQAAKPMRKAATAKGLSAQFERLAEWKTSRGTPTRVFTVSEIVDLFEKGGLAPELPPPSTLPPQGGLGQPDLCTMLRAFVAHARRLWGTQYILIGGGPHIVPMRYVVSRDVGYGTVGADVSPARAERLQPSSNLARPASLWMEQGPAWLCCGWRVAGE